MLKLVSYLTYNLLLSVDLIDSPQIHRTITWIGDPLSAWSRPRLSRRSVRPSLPASCSSCRPLSWLARCPRSARWYKPNCLYLFDWPPSAFWKTCRVRSEKNRWILNSKISPKPIFFLPILTTVLNRVPCGLLSVNSVESQSLFEVGLLCCCPHSEAPSWTW